MSMVSPGEPGGGRNGGASGGPAASGPGGTFFGMAAPAASARRRLSR